MITPEEIEFIQGLAPLFETPRAAKRLANVYRLMRVSVGADRLTRDEGYEPALLLLAIGIGFPGLAGELFDAIRSQPSTSWPDFVQRASGGRRRPPQAEEPPRPRVTGRRRRPQPRELRAVDRRRRRVLVPSVAGAPARDGQELAGELDSLRLPLA